MSSSDEAAAPAKRRKGERSSNPWSAEEDAELMNTVNILSASLGPDVVFEEWKQVSKRLSTKRTSKQCKDRYRSKLDPTINHGPWRDEEDERLLKLADEFPRQWSKIARHLRGRTEHAVKSRVATLARLKIKDWSQEEDDQLTRLREGGLEFEGISTYFPSRSIHSIKKRWERLYMNSLAEKIRSQQPPPPVQAVVVPSSPPPSIAVAPVRQQAAFPVSPSRLSPSAALSPPRPVQRQVSNSRLARHSTSMTVLLQVLGDPFPDSALSPSHAAAVAAAAAGVAPVGSSPHFAIPPHPLSLNHLAPDQRLHSFLSSDTFFGASFPMFAAAAAAAAAAQNVGNSSFALNSPTVNRSEGFHSRLDAMLAMPTDNDGSSSAHDPLPSPTAFTRPPGFQAPPASSGGNGTTTPSTTQGGRLSSYLSDMLSFHEI